MNHFEQGSLRHQRQSSANHEVHELIRSFHQHPLSWGKSESQAKSTSAFLKNTPTAKLEKKTESNRWSQHIKLAPSAQVGTAIR